MITAKSHFTTECYVKTPRAVMHPGEEGGFEILGSRSD